MAEVKYPHISSREEILQISSEQVNLSVGKTCHVRMP